ncbi:MAG TPA: ornithine cyclodeaminase [Synergistales bacterium]|nr:ornithine cyclodeaminase [Synergistales bacterium]
MNSRAATFLYLSQSDVIKCGGLDMTMVLDKVEEVLALRDRGETSMPDKISLKWKGWDINSRINAMPGFVGGKCNTGGIKWIGSKPENPSKYGIPRASALIILNDPETAFPICVMDGTLISAMRTGAVTGVGARYLARKASRSVALIGAGAQNHTQLKAVLTVLPGIEDIRVCDLSPERVRTFIDHEKSGNPGLNFRGTTEARDAVEGADIIISATTTLKPIVRAEWVRDGAYISNVGNYEYEYDVVRKASKILADNWEAVIHRKNQTAARMLMEGELQEKELYGELGEVINGKRPGRENDREIIFFSPIGMGIEDVIVAREIYDRAESQTVGTRLILWDEPLWV